MQCDIYISPTGNDGWSGKLPEPNTAHTDGPLRTLEAARDALRLHQPGGGTVWLRGGDYERAASFELTAEDSGTVGAPIIYRAVEGETVRLLGGRRLEPGAFAPVTEPKIVARLTASARGHVVQCDLRAQGIEDFGTFASRGFQRPTSPAHLELFFNDKPMTVAQWPKAGQFATIAGFTKPMANEWGAEVGDLTGGFTYEGDRPARWAPCDDLWVHGYWAYDWANSYERVLRLDPLARVVETAPPHGNYSFTKGQRFYFLNVLEELDGPGEYYVDRERGRLYFWPPNSAEAATKGRPASLEGADILVSELSGPLLKLNDVSHVTFRGLTIEGGRGDGVHIDGGEGDAIADCVIRNLGNGAVVIRGGTRHAVSGCDIYGTGDGGICLTGGERATLAACEHAVLDNHIHHYARWTRTYVPGVSATGVGMRIARNRIHDAPHIAILFWGNDFLIEHNEIHHVCLETGDAGAIYTGRDYTFRGNVIRRNFIHHLGGVGYGSMGIYMDDCVSGTTIVENTIWECQHGIFLGGGRDFRVEHNILVNCRLPIHADARGIDPNPVWQNMVNNTMRERYEAMRPHEPPYSTRYPEIADIAPCLAAGKGVPPENNRVERNLVVQQVGSFHIMTDGARFDRNLYWCATGPVRFEKKAGRVYGSQAFTAGFKAEATRFAPLSEAVTIHRFVSQFGDAEAPAGTGAIQLTREGDTLHVCGEFRRPRLFDPGRGDLWLREHVELFLKPFADRPGMVQLGLSADGETAVVWHDCPAPAEFGWQAEAVETTDGWQATLQIPLGIIAIVSGGKSLPSWSYLAGFTTANEVDDWKSWQAAGHDLHGLVADPLFVAPGNGNFDLRPGSPALKFGFVSTPVDSGSDEGKI